MCSSDGSSREGFSLIELLIVVSIIGIIAMVAIPNLMNALHRSRQSRTMSDMRSLAQAVELYQQDLNAYPEAPGGCTAEDLRTLLDVFVGNYTALDGWRRPMIYTSDGTVYTLVSYAANGAPDLPYHHGATHLFEEDIVFSVGTFLQWPEGVQR
ncbi:MAG: type II secretion system protein GspG [Acidobacteriota bacterium]|jgi:general secretion pathway protein G